MWHLRPLITLLCKFIYFIKRLFCLQPWICSSTTGFNEWFFFLFFFCWPTTKLFSVFENEKCLLHCTPPTTMRIWGMASAPDDPVVVASCIPSDAEVPLKILWPQREEDTLRSDTQPGGLTLYLFWRGNQGYPNWFHLSNIFALMIRHLSHTMNSVIKMDNALSGECPVVWRGFAEL